MKKTTIPLIAIILCTIAVSAQDTTYYKKPFFKTTRDKADFYRVWSIDSLGFKIMEYSIDGVLTMTGHSLKSDTLVENGLFTYYNDGVISSQGNYSHQKMTGDWKTYYDDGPLHTLAHYDDKGNYDGVFTAYYRDGKVRRTDIYKNGKLKDKNCYTATGADTTWYPFETYPSFPGGDSQRIRFLQENITYPKQARQNGIQGIVYVTFIVEKDGTIRDVGLIRGVYKLLDDEALRIIQKMPRWEPGTLDGKPVRVQFNMPISFRLTN